MAIVFNNLSNGGNGGGSKKYLHRVPINVYFDGMNMGPMDFLLEIINEKSSNYTLEEVKEFLSNKLGIKENTSYKFCLEGLSMAVTYSKLFINVNNYGGLTVSANVHTLKPTGGDEYSATAGMFTVESFLETITAVNAYEVIEI